jgi:hypothetical protein
MKYVPAFLMMMIGLICMTAAFTVTVLPAPNDPSALHLTVCATIAFVVGAVRVWMED